MLSMSNSAFSIVENLTLASAIGHIEGFLPDEILTQMKNLRPVVEIMTKSAIIDYLVDPSYKNKPASKRILDSNANATISNLLSKPDVGKTELISNSLTREYRSKIADVNRQIQVSGETSDNFLTLDEEDIDALLTINPTAFGGDTIQSTTAMSEAMATMWKDQLHEPNQVFTHEDTIQFAYQLIHEKIAERLTAKKEIMLNIIEQRRLAAEAKKLLESTPKPHDERAKYLFHGWEDIADSSLIYEKVANVGQNILMLESFAAVNTESAVQYLKKTLRRTESSQAINRNTSLEDLVLLFKTEMTKMLAKQLDFTKPESEQILNSNDIGNEISFFFAQSQPSLEVQSKIFNFLPSVSKSNKLSPVEEAGIKILTEAFKLRKT